MEVFLGIIIFVLGLCVGSFVNMLIYRTAVRYGLRPSLRGPRCGGGRSNPPPEAGRHEIATPRRTSGLAMTDSRSFCDFCGKQLKWYENIPVVSWLIQKGKSRCCHKKLPAAYPLLELFTGLMFVINFEILKQVQNDAVMLAVSLVIITLLIFSMVFDLKYMILPDFSTGILVGCAVVLLLTGRPQGSPVQYFVSAAAASGFLGLLYIVTKGKGMGLGDVKLGVFLGLFLGWPKIIVAFYLAFISGATAGIILLGLKKVKMKSKIAFGPFLIMATLFTWYYGDNIWYYVLGIMY